MSTQERFEEHLANYGEFDKVKNKLSERPDVHAFKVLEKLFPSSENLIIGCKTNELYIEIRGEQFDGINDLYIITLIRSGVTYHPVFDCLVMRFGD